LRTDVDTATERAACVLALPMIVLALTFDAERSTRIRPRGRCHGPAVRQFHPTAASIKTRAIQVVPDVYLLQTRVLLDVRQRVRWEISHGRRPLKRRVVSVVPRPNAAITI